MYMYSYLASAHVSSNLSSVLQSVYFFYSVHYIFILPSIHLALSDHLIFITERYHSNSFAYAISIHLFYMNSL